MCAARGVSGFRVFGEQDYPWASSILNRSCASTREAAMAGVISGSHIREARLADHDALVALWQACGITLPPVSTRVELARKLQRDPDLFLVAGSQAGLPGRSWAPMTGAGAG
jgi:hypothetical protein